MAYYTLSIKELYDIYGTGKTVEEKIKSTSDWIFNFNFPWYNNNSDGSLENFKKLFTEHYFTEEIGFETVALWKLKLQEVFYRKIPYYTDLYKALNIDYNPLINFNVDHESESISTDKNSGEDITVNSHTGNDTDTFTSTENSNTTLKHSGDIKIVGNDSLNSNVTNSGTDTVNSTDNSTTNSENSTTNTTSGKNQNIHSDFPQANFSPKTDYASGMDRGQNDSTITDKGTNKTNVNTTGKTTTDHGLKTSTANTSKNDNTTTFDNTDTTTNTNTKNDKDLKEYNSKNTNTLTHGHVLTGNENKTAKDMGWNGGSKTDELEKYRSAIRNLNEMLLNEFSETFMSVYQPLENDIWYSPLKGVLS
nr:MAG TPA: Lower collar protein [Caudoviricetes sp.]